MEEIASTRFSVSYHLKDLLKRDPQTIKEICTWLETHAETKRDRAQRRGSRRMMARLIAARQLLKAAESGDVAAAREVMDRTEGKVADRLITLDVNDMVRQLEAGRQRVLAAHNALTLDSQDVDSITVAEHTLDQVSNVGQAIEGQVPATRVHASGSHQGEGDSSVPTLTRKEEVESE